MNKVVSKLYGKKGVSIIIALIIFLLCALAGASAFFMAASNAGRYSHPNDQNYYTVSSAALMFVDMLDDLRYESGEVKYVYKRTWEYGKDGKTEHTVSDGHTLTIPKDAVWIDNDDLSNEDKKNGKKASGASTLRKSGLDLCTKILTQSNALVPYYVPDEWYESADNIVKEGDANPFSKPTGDLDRLSYSFTITVPGDSRFGTVNCTLVMTNNYDLTVTFVGENSVLDKDDGAEGGEYAITVYWQAVVEQEKKVGTPKYDYYTDTDYKSGKQTQTDTLKIIAEWKKENVTISRGEVKNESHT